MPSDFQSNSATELAAGSVTQNLPLQNPIAVGLRQPKTVRSAITTRSDAPVSMPNTLLVHAVTARQDIAARSVRRTTTPVPAASSGKANTANTMLRSRRSLLTERRAGGLAACFGEYPIFTACTAPIDPSVIDSATGKNG